MVQSTTPGLSMIERTQLHQKGSNLHNVPGNAKPVHVRVLYILITDFAAMRLN